MNDEQVIAEAAEQGFELEQRLGGRDDVWGWCRGDDTRWPCFLERRQAIGWIADRLNRIRGFA
jgi:hypothetical protein